MNIKEIQYSAFFICTLMVLIHLKNMPNEEQNSLPIANDYENNPEILEIDSMTIEKSTDSYQYSESETKTDSIKSGYLGKKKPDPEGWSKKYGKYLQELFI